MGFQDKMPRLARITSLLVKLQTKSFVSVQELAKHYKVSKRTIYRDIQSLEQSGIPILSIENKGFTLIDGFNIPPIMFSESEANALIVAEKFVERTKDESLVTEFRKAIDKIKSVLNTDDKEKSNLLSERTIIGKNWSEKKTSKHLSKIQKALTHRNVVFLSYQKEGQEDVSKRKVEPFAIYHNTSDNWVLIAWCRLRKDFRNFRLDRNKKCTVSEAHFEQHDISLSAYIEMQRIKYFKSVT